MVELKERVLRPEHPDTLVSLNNPAALLAVGGRHAEAEPLFVRLVDARRRVLGEQHPQTRSAVESLAELRTQRKDTAPPASNLATPR